jgi:hypothetical protein
MLFYWNGCLGLLAVGLLLAGASGARAAKVQYTLSLNDDGKGRYSAGRFAVYADVKTRGTGGIFGFGVDLKDRTALTWENRSPKVSYRDPAGVDGSLPAGFTAFRTIDKNDVSVSGAQDIFGGGSVLIRGFGTKAGDLSKSPPRPRMNSELEEGLWELAGATQGKYADHLLLAAGTFKNSKKPAWETTSADNAVSLFKDNSSTMTEVAQINFVTKTLAPRRTRERVEALAAGGVAPSFESSGAAAVPEPGAMAIVGAGIGVMLRRTRKR